MNSLEGRNGTKPAEKQPRGSREKWTNSGKTEDEQREKEIMSKERTKRKNPNEQRTNTEKAPAKGQALRLDFDPPSFDFERLNFSLEDLPLLDNDFIENLSKWNLSELFQGLDFERTQPDTKRKAR